MSKRSPSAERLYRARKQASRELKLPVEDWRVKRYAVLMCAHNGVQARLASGADINVDNLLKLDTAMREVRASAPQKPLKVSVALVEGPVEHCPACGWHRDQQPPPPPPSAPPPPADTKPSTPSAPAANVVPIRREQSGGGSIHDQPGVPLKRLQNEPWRQFVGPVGDP